MKCFGQFDIFNEFEMYTGRFEIVDHPAITEDENKTFLMPIYVTVSG